MTLPNLSTERLEQMIHLATSYSQEKHLPALPWYTQAFNALHARSMRLAYGIGAGAVSLSCIGAFWVVPMMTTQSEVAVSDFSVSEYIMQDLLEDLSQSTFGSDFSFQA